MTSAAPPTPTTFLEALQQVSRGWPDRVAAVRPAERGADPPAGDRTMTHGELWRAAMAQAEWYRSLGVQPGDRILCAMPNSLEHLVTVAAAWARGAVHVGVDHTLTVPELAWMIEHVGAAALVVQGRRLDHAGLGTRVLHVEDAPSAGTGGEPDSPSPEDVAAIIFSSGTTGTPTGSIATHGRFAAGWVKEAGRLRFGPDDVHLVQVPLAHGYGLQLAMMGLLTGGRLVLVERFSAREALRLIAEHGVTVFNGTPPHYIGVLAAMTERPDLSVASLRTGIGSADHFPPRLLSRIFDELGMEFMNMYGSNMGFGVTTTDQELMLRGSVGKPPPGSVAIVDQDHVPVPVGEIGEIAFRYRPGEANVWQASRALDRSKRWYYTGDLGRLDADGYLFLAGRVKHQVNRGGMKIDPAEVLNELFGCEGVADAAVIGIPDAFLGEVVCACVVPSTADRPPTLEGLRRALGERLAPHKLPEELYLLDEIPRTANGKVEIATLTERAAAGGAGVDSRAGRGAGGGAGAGSIRRRGGPGGRRPRVRRASGRAASRASGADPAGAGRDRGAGGRVRAGDRRDAGGSVAVRRAPEAVAGAGDPGPGRRVRAPGGPRRDGAERPGPPGLVPRGAADAERPHARAQPVTVPPGTARPAAAAGLRAAAPGPERAPSAW